MVAIKLTCQIRQMLYSHTQEPMFEIQFPFGEKYDSQILTCGLVLPPNQAAVAIELHHEISRQSKHPLKFHLSQKNHPPFVRLYETVLPSKNLPAAMDRLKSISELMSPFHMEWGEIETTHHMVIVWGESNQIIQTFQEAVLVAVNPLREGDYKQKYQREREAHLFTPDQEKSLEKWGSPWADPYVPHMVLAKAHPDFGGERKSWEWVFQKTEFSGLFVATRAGEEDFNHWEVIPFLQKA